jgi:hypothetical protein
MGYAASSRKSWGGRFREDTRRYEGSTGDFESFREKLRKLKKNLTLY